MPTLRIVKNSDFFVASRLLFQDVRISLEARGLMGYLLSKPDNWKPRFSDMMTQGQVGRDKLRTILHELFDNGYMTRKRVHTEGRIDWEYTVYDVSKKRRNTPIVGAKTSDKDELQSTEKQPIVRQPIAGQPTENQPIYKEVSRENSELQSSELHTARSLKNNERATRASVKKVKTYMPDDFKVYEDDKKAIAHEALGKYGSKVNAQEVFEKFVADAEAKGLKYVDWSAAWRSRCKQEVYYAKRDGIIKDDEGENRVPTVRERRAQEKGATT